MNITVNNDPMEVSENITVDKLIELVGFQQYQLAVALNNQVVTKTKWQQTSLHENDNIIIIKAVSGG
jgi:sulfur carrier protein